MKYLETTQSGQKTVSIVGQITTRDAKDFPFAVEAYLRGCGRTLVIDLQGVDYMDSSGLGFLILLRNAAEAKGTEVVLHGAKGEVGDLLRQACFDTLFRLA